LLPHHARLFEHCSRNKGPSAARILSSPIVSEEFLWQWNRRQEVFRDYADAGERILLEKYLNFNMQSQSEGWSSRTRKAAAWKIPGSEPLQPDFDFDLGQLGGIVFECAHQLLMDLFWIPILSARKPDDKSLFLFLHLSSLTDFINYPKWSKPVPFPDFLSRNRLSQFTCQSYALCSSKWGSLWAVERIEMGGGRGLSGHPRIIFYENWEILNSCQF
jgi:hypothetical protein